MLEGKTYMEKQDYEVITLEGNEQVSQNEMLRDCPSSVWSDGDSHGFALDSDHWLAAWPTLESKHGEKFMQEFWCLYASEMPYKEREKILFPSLSNADSPMHVMQTAMCLDDFDEEIRSLESGEPVRLDGPFGGLPANGRSAVEIAKETRLEAMEELGTWLKGCILNKNAAALRSLANSLHIEYPWEEQANKNKEPQLKPRLLYSFCELLQKNRAIPTRVELEDAAGIIRQVESGKASSKNVASALKSLGLDVLPK